MGGYVSCNANLGGSCNTNLGGPGMAGAGVLLHDRPQSGCSLSELQLKFRVVGMS